MREERITQTECCTDQRLFYPLFEVLSMYHFNNSRSISFSYVIFLELPRSVLITTGATYEKHQHLCSFEEN